MKIRVVKREGGLVSIEAEGRRNGRPVQEQSKDLTRAEAKVEIARLASELHPKAPSAEPG